MEEVKPSLFYFTDMEVKPEETKPAPEGFVYAPMRHQSVMGKYRAHPYTSSEAVDAVAAADKFLSYSPVPNDDSLVGSESASVPLVQQVQAQELSQLQSLGFAQYEPLAEMCPPLFSGVAPPIPIQEIKMKPKTPLPISAPVSAPRTRSKSTLHLRIFIEEKIEEWISKPSNPAKLVQLQCTIQFADGKQVQLPLIFRVCIPEGMKNLVNCGRKLSFVTATRATSICPVRFELHPVADSGEEQLPFNLAIGTRAAKDDHLAYVCVDPSRTDSGTTCRITVHTDIPHVSLAVNEACSFNDRWRGLLQNHIRAKVSYDDVS